MKKSYLFLLLGLISLAFASCQKEELPNAQLQSDSKVDVSATLADANLTKTQHNSDFTKVLWVKNDLLSVFSPNKGTVDHDRYYLTDGDGSSKANFKWDKTYGTISGGTTDADNSEKGFYVSVYPFMESTSVKHSNNSYTINTVLPTEQKYAANSFGEGALVMVAVDEINPKPDFAFKNTGAILVFPLKGDVVIKSATLSSKKSKIAGNAVITVSAENQFVPSTDVSNGKSEITLSCGEGVQLKNDEYTNFSIVLAPGTYKDLVIKFSDAFGNYFEQEIENPNNKEMKRSTTYIMPEMTFKAQGTEQVDLWVKAQAGAYMNAERIIPSIKDGVGLVDWVTNLKNHEDVKGVIEQAVTYITLQNYKGAYEVLGGVPGFVNEVKRFEATGSFIQKVDYTGSNYIVSMLEDIEKINDIPSLLKYIEDFENLYEASGLKNQLDKSLGSIADNFDTFIDEFIDLALKNDENMSEEEALAKYKEDIKKSLKNSIDACNGTIELIDYALKLSNSFEKYVKEERASMVEYVTAAQALYNDIDKLSKKDIEKRIDAIKPVVITFEIPDWLNFFGISIPPVDIQPSTFLGSAEDIFKKAISNSETSINVIKAGLRTAISEISSLSLVESLEKAINEPTSITGQVLNYLFAQETFMEYVKSTLRTIVEGIEEASKLEIGSNNMNIKELAIQTAATNSILQARVNATELVKEKFNATNNENLTSGPWGAFKKVLNWEPCVQAFTDLRILEVYDALVKLTEVIDEMITYDKGAVLYNIENLEDYQENVDWWVLQFNEEL